MLNLVDFITGSGHEPVGTKAGCSWLKLDGLDVNLIESGTVMVTFDCQFDRI